MDRLAAQGMRFDRAYTQNPICTPSRVSFLSGQSPQNHGYFGLGGPTPKALPSVFSHFKSNGYRTAGIGKLHLPDEPRNWVADDLDVYGDCYRSVDGQPTQGPYWDYLDAHGLRDTEDSRIMPEVGHWIADSRPSNMPFEHCVESWCVNQSKAFIDASGETPFFLHCSFPRPHHQLTPDQRFLDLIPEDIEVPPEFDADGSHRPPHFRKQMEAFAHIEWTFDPKDHASGRRRAWRGYLACIAQVDWAVGQLLDHLEARGLADNTVVVYSSDHGAYHGLFGLREKVPGISSEAVCRIPLLWRVPGATSGQTTRAFFQNNDLIPTLCSLCGLPQLESTDGMDLSSVLQNPDSSPRTTAVTENAWSQAIRWDDWRLVHYPEALFGSDEGELYHLGEDPGETRNLYHDPAHQPVVAEGRKHLLDHLLTQRRNVTHQPSKPGGQMGIHPYDLAGDGKESNSYGVTGRRDQGKLDYL
jgi:arylsulfatase A-like enzyme